MCTRVYVCVSTCRNVYACVVQSTYVVLQSGPCSACGDARQPQRRAGALEREGEQNVAEKQAYAWAVRSDD